MSCRAVSDKYNVEYDWISFDKSRNGDKVLTQSECLPFEQSSLLFTDDYFSNGSYNLDVVYSYLPYAPMVKYDLEILLVLIIAPIRVKKKIRTKKRKNLQPNENG